MSLLLFFNLLFSSFAPGDLTKTEVAGNIFMSLPADFRPMTDDEIASKYFTTQRPVALYTDLNVSVDVGVNKSVTHWNENDTEIMKGFQKANIFSLYDQVDMISEGVKELDGKQFVYFEFVSTVRGEETSFKTKQSIRKYSYIQYVIYKGQSLVFNFTCSERLKAQWEDTAGKIMDSIIIKGKLK